MISFIFCPKSIGTLHEVYVFTYMRICVLICIHMYVPMSGPEVGFEYLPLKFPGAGIVATHHCAQLSMQVLDI